MFLYYTYVITYMTPQEKTIYEELKLVGSEIETETCNQLESPFIDTVIATLDFFNVNERQMKISQILLGQDKIKVYDYLCMGICGRLDLMGNENNTDNGIFRKAIMTFAKLYLLQKDVGGFAWWLRGHDLDIEEPSRCEDCIQSYANWKQEMELKN